jgi:hypothetical protein
MRSQKPLLRLALGLAVAVVVAACGRATESGLVAAEEKWSATETDDYNLDMEISCFCGLTGSYEVSVREGQVAEILYLMDGTWTEAPEGITPPTEWFTVEGLFEVVRENLDADKIRVRYGEQGYPTSIDLDVSTEESDDDLQISAVLQKS